MQSTMNHFTPLNKICSGYFGVEHKVKEKRPRGKLRVAKLILCASQTQARCILAEYKKTVLSLAKHQNILNIKDAFLHKQTGSVYLCSVGKLLESSHTLNSFVLHSSLSEDAHKALFLQLVDAVLHLHTHGIAHNALTPFAVRVVESRGNALVKVTDFGLAQLCSQPDHERYDLDIARGRSLVYHLPPEAQALDWCDEFGQPNTAADVFMLGLMFNAIAEHSVLPEMPNQDKQTTEQTTSTEQTTASNQPPILASYLQFPGYGAVPIGKFMHENPSVELDYQLFRRLSPQFRRLIRRMVFLEPDGRPPIAGVLQMLEPMESLVRQTRRSARESVWSEASLDIWEEDLIDTKNPHFHPTKPKQPRKTRVPYNPSISPIQKRFTGSTMVLTERNENPVQRATGFVRRASMRVKKTSDRLRKRGSAKISG